MPGKTWISNIDVKNGPVYGPSAFFVLVVLCNIARGPEGYLDPERTRISALMEATEFSDRTVTDCLKKLEDLGRIRAERARGKVSVYELLVPKILRHSDNESTEENSPQDRKIFGTKRKNFRHSYINGDKDSRTTTTDSTAVVGVNLSKNGTGNHSLSESKTAGIKHSLDDPLETRFTPPPVTWPLTMSPPPSNDYVLKLRQAGYRIDQIKTAISELNCKPDKPDIKGSVANYLKAAIDRTTQRQEDVASVKPDESRYIVIPKGMRK